MKVLRGFSEVRLDTPGSAVTIGNFDGVHRGHQAAIYSTVEAARRRGLTSVVCTFDPHTRVHLHPDAPPRLLETLDQRIAGFEILGVDVAVVIPFGRDVAEIPRQDFVRRFLRASLRAVELHVSEAFTFGASGKGDVEFLRDVAPQEGFQLFVVESVMAGGWPVSSSRIREAVAAGRVTEATKMLGRPFALTGEVVAGEGRGRDLRARTANLAFDGQVLPARGVYVTEVRIDNRTHRSVTNVGVRPTFGDGDDVSVETHLLDSEADLYGVRLELAFLERLRDEIRFDGPAALAAQIQRDIEQATAYFSGTG